MMNSKAINAVQNEKDVENNYRQYLTKKFGDIVFNSPVKCDGYGESKKHNVRILCEFKDDLDLNQRVNQIKVLCQAVYYIKKFEIAGKILPSVIFVGDRDECFAIHTNDVFKYLGMDLDWSLPPSSAHTNINLYRQMMDDGNINPFVFTITHIDQCIDKIKQLTDGVKRLIPITPHNITEVYRYFEDNVVGKTKLDTNQLANLFVQILVNPVDNFVHPKKKNILFTKSQGDIPLKSSQNFKSFFSHFASEYSPKQKEYLTAVVDRLVQDTTRRKQGEFFTPTIWVDKAHEYISSVFGEDWKEKYVVWDPAWGTGNLTRDYKFKELYCSTLVSSDIETANQMGYNPEATKFQYDFLNDPYEYLPIGLKKAIESGKKIIVLMNPPYARSNGDGKVGTVKKDAAKTMISEEMKTNQWGSSSSQLYSQFLYRIHKLNEKGNIEIAVFSKSVYKTGETFKNFRLNFYKKYKFHKGFLFNATHFSDTTDSWGVDFSIWGQGNENRDYLPINLLDYTIEGFIDIGIKNLYNMDNAKKASDWVKKILKGKKTVDKPQMTSALKIKNSSGDFIVENSLGCFMNKMNSVMVNDTWVSLLSSSSSKGNGGVSILPENFVEVITVFAARKTISQNWINDKDEYFEPNTLHPNFKEFSYDSIVFSLFNSSSEQSSLRHVEYKDQLWNIKNEFFWMSKNEMMELCNQNNYDDLYNDARTDQDRHVHTLLFGTERLYDRLSQEAKDVLDCATELVRDSIQMRIDFADPQNHLNSWDAGYAQLKLLWKEYFPERFKEFREKFKVLEDKMRPMVYELGFLKK